MHVLALLFLFACSDEPTEEVPPSAPSDAVVEANDAEAPPRPKDRFPLADAVSFEPEATHAAAMKGSPVLDQAYGEVLAALAEAKPAGERVARVALLRDRARKEVPAEDEAGMALRGQWDAAVNDALGAFFLAYASQLADSDLSADDKAASVEALEAVLLKGSWDWDLAARDQVQTRLMMALRTL